MANDEETEDSAAPIGKSVIITAFVERVLTVGSMGLGEGLRQTWDFFEELGLLNDKPADLVEYAIEDAVALVAANNKSAKTFLKPLARCPEMVIAEACEICFWRDAHTDTCRGG